VALARLGEQGPVGRKLNKKRFQQRKLFLFLEILEPFWQENMCLPSGTKHAALRKEQTTQNNFDASSNVRNQVRNKE
jgi:hypothetical protein